MSFPVPADVGAAIDQLADRVARSVREQLRMDACLAEPAQLQPFAGKPDELARHLLVVAFDCDPIVSEFGSRYSPSQQQRLRRMRHC